DASWVPQGSVCELKFLEHHDEVTMKLCSTVVTPANLVELRKFENAALHRVECQKDQVTCPALAPEFSGRGIAWTDPSTMAGASATATAATAICYISIETLTAAPSQSPTPSTSASPSASPSVIATPSSTPSVTPSPSTSATASPSISETPSVTPSI